MDLKLLFQEWAERNRIEGNENLYFAFKAGYELVGKKGLVVYGAENRHELGLLLDDLSYWFGNEKPVVRKGVKERIYMSLDNFCKAYVLINAFVSRGRFKKRAFILRDRNRIVKKYRKRKLYLRGAMYFKFLCKHFGVLEQTKTRFALIELAARNKWWPLCAWDISMSRPIMSYPDRWNMDRVIKVVPPEWKDDMEKFVLTYFSRKKSASGD